MHCENTEGRHKLAAEHMETPPATESTTDRARSVNSEHAQQNRACLTSSTFAFPRRGHQNVLRIYSLSFTITEFTYPLGGAHELLPGLMTEPLPE